MIFETDSESEVWFKLHDRSFQKNETEINTSMLDTDNKT